MKSKFIILLTIVFFALTGNVFAQSEDPSICEIICPQFAVIDFTKTITLGKKAKLQLDSTMKIAKQWPMCNKIRVVANGTSSEQSQQQSWDRVAAVIMYLRKRGIEKQRLIFVYGEEGNPNIVNIQGCKQNDMGPWWTPPPHPRFSLHKRKVTAFGYK